MVFPEITACTCIFEYWEEHGFWRKAHKSSHPSLDSCCVCNLGKAPEPLRASPSAFICNEGMEVFFFFTWLAQFSNVILNFFVSS